MQMNTDQQMSRHVEDKKKKSKLKNSNSTLLLEFVFPRSNPMPNTVKVVALSLSPRSPLTKINFQKLNSRTRHSHAHPILKACRYGS